MYVSIQNAFNYHSKSPGFVMLLALNVFLAYFVNLANFLVTRHTSALTLQVLGNAKGVIAAGVSVLLFKNQLTPLGVLGYGITVCGVFAYSEVCARFCSALNLFVLFVCLGNDYVTAIVLPLEICTQHRLCDAAATRKKRLKPSDNDNTCGWELVHPYPVFLHRQSGAKSSAALPRHPNCQTQLNIYRSWWRRGRQNPTCCEHRPIASYRARTAAASRCKPLQYDGASSAV